MLCRLILTRCQATETSNMPNRKEIKVIEEAFPPLLDEQEDNPFLDMREIAAQIPPEVRVNSFIEWHKKMKIHD